MKRGTKKRIYGSTLSGEVLRQNFRRAKSFVGGNVRHLDKNSPDDVSSDKVKGSI